LYVPAAGVGYLVGIKIAVLQITDVEFALLNYSLAALRQLLVSYSCSLLVIKLEADYRFFSKIHFFTPEKSICGRAFAFAGRPQD
jgi:hypothetical protein